EAARIDALLASGRVAVDVLGESVQGRPIRLLRIGDPPPQVTDRAVLLYVGAQHGNEPAGREALLSLAEQLSTTTDPDVVSFLHQYGVLIVPTLNPDGILAGTRQNANGVDLNRDHIGLVQPETRALARVLGSARPLIVVDQHEGPGGLSDDLEFLGPTNPQVRSQITSHAAAIISAMEARAVMGGWSTDVYNGGDGANVLRNCSGLRHSVGVLIESDGDDDSPAGQADRLARHLAMSETVLEYAVGQVDDLLTDTAEAEQAAAAEGAAGTTPFDLAGDGGVVLDPPPLGYRLAGVLPTLHLQVFGVAVAH